MVLNIFPFPFLEKCEDLDTNKFATVSSRTPLVSAPRWGPLLRVNVPVLLHGNSGVSALCSSSQWGRKSLGSRILQHGVKQCQNILKVWALANCFSRTGHSVLTTSISAASTSESSKSSQSQIDFFFFFNFSLATEVKQTNMIFPSSRQLMMTVWQPHGFGSNTPLRWLFFVKEVIFTSFPRAPRMVRTESGTIPLGHSPQVSCH